jgi:hypothetical protein
MLFPGSIDSTIVTAQKIPFLELFDLLIVCIFMHLTSCMFSKLQILFLVQCYFIFILYFFLLVWFYMKPSLPFSYFGINSKTLIFANFRICFKSAFKSLQTSLFIFTSLIPVPCYILRKFFYHKYKYMHENLCRDSQIKFE